MSQTFQQLIDNPNNQTNIDELTNITHHSTATNTSENDRNFENNNKPNINNVSTSSNICLEPIITINNEFHQGIENYSMFNEQINLSNSYFALN
ncbi:unnamed protein product [Rotaria magnacalcarata]|uniref:Uncharacterized protein n=2 Tax=Rotaria magnacalcarata TaxID=392030 RepID=A0A816SZY9_9BILA|nr:unnamed protein product [Rotaria magnacalcarata]